MYFGIFWKQIIDEIIELYGPYSFMMRWRWDLFPQFHLKVKVIAADRDYQSMERVTFKV